MKRKRFATEQIIKILLVEEHILCLLSFKKEPSSPDLYISHGILCWQKMTVRRNK